jgi:hypothetical protein
MDFDLTEDQVRLRDGVGALLAKFTPPYRAERDERTRVRARRTGSGLCRIAAMVPPGQLAPARVRPQAWAVGGLSVRFGGVAALTGVSVSVPTGRVYDHRGQMRVA